MGWEWSSFQEGGPGRRAPRLRPGQGSFLPRYESSTASRCHFCCPHIHPLVAALSFSGFRPSFFNLPMCVGGQWLSRTPWGLQSLPGALQPPARQTKQLEGPQALCVEADTIGPPRQQPFPFPTLQWSPVCGFYPPPETLAGGRGWGGGAWRAHEGVLTEWRGPRHLPSSSPSQMTD